MCKYTLCENLTKLNTFLIEAVYIPYKSLEHNFILKVSKKSSESLRCECFTNNDTGRASTFKVLIFILISFSTCKGYDLCSYIRT